jgi:MoxR-like ATPase
VTVAESVLAHRIILDRKAAATGETPQGVIRSLLARIPVDTGVASTRVARGKESSDSAPKLPTRR